MYSKTDKKGTKKTIRQFSNQQEEWSKGIKKLEFWSLLQPD
jgi:hypothetical protein